MAGLVPAIHVFDATAKQDVDARAEPGHDERIVLRYDPGSAASSPHERSDMRADKRNPDVAESGAHSRDPSAHPGYGAAALRFFRDGATGHNFPDIALV
jgi:hypothetical protein